MFLQQLWSLKCGWDEPIPPDHLDQWLSQHSELQGLEELKLPRWTAYGSNTLQATLHGFSDASTKAYAACAYLRVVDVDGSVTVSLIAAKSKVAPLKTMSVPRLELSAANLLARLINFIKAVLQLTAVECFCWSDSTIALAWLKKSPHHWKTFVANRVSSIQTKLPGVTWRHVATKDNPADYASRGLTPNELLNCRSWWLGPEWLVYPPDRWPDLIPVAHPDRYREESKPVLVCNVHVSEEWDLVSRFSSWPRLLRVTAYIQRFVKRSRKATRALAIPSESRSIQLAPEEIQIAKSY